MLTTKYKYELPPLPYAYNANEPYIDEETMRIHHGKHFQAYIDNLNKALEPYPRLQEMTLEHLLTNLCAIPAEVRTAIINNGGGVYNHDLYFKVIGPVQANNMPTGKLKAAIEKSFISFDNFKRLFTESAKSVFGSGWTWLVKIPNDNLMIVNSANQDTPLHLGYCPIMLVDVWEHAYYLKYQNRRPEYLDNIWKLVNWKKAEENYLKCEGISTNICRNIWE